MNQTLLFSFIDCINTKSSDKNVLKKNTQPFKKGYIYIYIYNLHIKALFVAFNLSFFLFVTLLTSLNQLKLYIDMIFSEMVIYINIIFTAYSMLQL